MLDKLATIVASAFAIGWVLVVAAVLLGEGSLVAWLAWLTGGALVLLSLPVLLLVVGALLLRLLGRATGVLATPVEPAVPQPGWDGFQLTLDGVEHELWIPAEGPGRRVLLDGAWVRTGSWGRRRTTFEVAGHRAELAGSVDWPTTIKAAPLVLAVGLLDGVTGEPPAMRYELLIDGSPRPRTERRTFGREGPPAVAVPVPSAVPPPGRQIRLDPPS